MVWLVPRLSTHPTFFIVALGVALNTSLASVSRESGGLCSPEKTDLAIRIREGRIYHLPRSSAILANSASVGPLNICPLRVLLRGTTNWNLI
ncbi:hypothetical protein Plhal304r1_c043g0123901 [Plasmopara halstedii]